MGETDFTVLAGKIREWATELGFQQAAITGTDLSAHAQWLDAWLANGYHGDMQWMAARRDLRLHPDTLLPGTLRVITVRMDYRVMSADADAILASDNKAYISRYALGRDYHKLVRRRLAQLADNINAVIPHSYRAFVDSAPVLERALAEQSGLGWIGKNTMLINSKAGSWFFLGEILTNLPLPVDTNDDHNRCGTCTACLDICPTNAFTGPHTLDARRCISYLTIEHKGAIAEDLRPLMGNRIFGCDDCQLVCPWNKFAQHSNEKDFQPRHQLDDCEMVDLFRWTEEEYLQRTEGSALRRIGHERWLRNIAIALGNASYSKDIIGVLSEKAAHPSALVREHVEWALGRQLEKSGALLNDAGG